MTVIQSLDWKHLRRWSSIGAAIVCAMLFGASNHAHATPPPPPGPWQQHVWDADFVGIVECVRSGPESSKYRVVDAWKGDIPGEFWLGLDELCGQRRLVLLSRMPGPIAYRGYIVPFAIPQYSSVFGKGSWEPIWPGPLPEWYFVWGADAPRVPDETRPGSYPIYDEFRSPDAFRYAVENFVGASPEKRELELIRGYLVPRNWGAIKDDTIDRLDYRAAIQVIDGTDDIETAVIALADLMAADPEYWKWEIPWVLARGGEYTFLALEDYVKKSASQKTDWATEILDAMRRRSVEQPVAVSDSSDTESPDGVSRRELLRLIKGQVIEYPADRSESWNRAFVRLTSADPGSIARYLVGLDKKHWYSRDDDRYFAVTYFALACESDRTNHLGRLMQSKDDSTRLIAAMIAFLDGIESGGTTLREFSLRDDPLGWWAASVLACAGDEDYVEHALNALRHVPGSLTADVDPTIRTTVAWMRALISNTAHASHVEPPEDYAGPYDLCYPSNPEALHRLLLSWWQEHCQSLSVSPLDHRPMPWKIHEWD